MHYWHHYVEMSACLCVVQKGSVTARPVSCAAGNELYLGFRLSSVMAANTGPAVNFPVDIVFICVSYLHSICVCDLFSSHTVM